MVPSFNGEYKCQHKVKAMEVCSVISFQVYLKLSSHLISSSSMQKAVMWSVKQKTG